jgi:hypothetical protein
LDFRETNRLRLRLRLAQGPQAESAIAPACFRTLHPCKSLTDGALRAQGVMPARKRTWSADTSFWPRGLMSYPSGRRCPSYHANFVNSTVRSADGAIPSTLRRRRQCRPPARRAHAPSTSIAHRACYCRLDLIHFADDVDCPRCAGRCGEPPPVAATLLSPVRAASPARADYSPLAADVCQRQPLKRIVHR